MRRRTGLGALLALSAAALASPLLGQAGSPAAERKFAPAERVQAPAASRAARISLSPDGQTVYVVGMILEGTFYDFDDVLAKAPKVRTVYLASNGGYTLDARLMAALVRKRKLDTYVEHYCASACTQVFVSGRNRVIGPAAVLGFHQAVLVDDGGVPTRSRAASGRKFSSTTVFGVNGNDTLRLSYQIGGLDPAFIDKALTYSHNDMWLPGTQELLDAHAITRQAATAELPPPPGGLGRAVVRERLMTLPLWQTALARQPAEAERAIDDVWRAANSGTSIEEATATGRDKLVRLASKDLARVPDAMLDRSLRISASSARNERAQGYPACRESLTLPAATPDPAAVQLIDQEDALMVDLFNSAERVAPMNGDEATKIFAREVMPLVLEDLKVTMREKLDTKCRLGFQLYEAIDAMPAKKRIRAYRAMLSLPGLEAAS